MISPPSIGITAMLIVPLFFELKTICLPSLDERRKYVKFSTTLIATRVFALHRQAGTLALESVLLESACAPVGVVAFTSIRRA
ncbi:MAG: hypothetical protein ACR2MG_15820 [Pyrinomonadaceae bacterium]